ncbi:MAG TPA: hypothetical protein VMM60_07395 [Ilumatobacter sp.]|nr:hypothetical protein [Ilumatobacter sp.]
MSAVPDQGGSTHEAARTSSTRAAIVAWGVVFAVAVIVGGAVLYLAATGLREAHLYRQRTGEGLRFFWVGVGFFVANGLLGAAAFLAGRLSSASAGAVRRAFVALAVVIVAVVVAADVLAVWVQAHGDRCIGRCG